jgi:hypothetical protein
MPARRGRVGGAKVKNMKIDTQIRHVTKRGANIFFELGFSPAEAERLQAASRKQIGDARQRMAQSPIFNAEDAE